MAPDTDGKKQQPQVQAGAGHRERQLPDPVSEYTATAIVFAGNSQFHCRASALSVSGVVLFPQVRAGRGTYLRINLCLPGFQDLLDLDAVILRETERNGYYAWRVKFHEASATNETLIRTFVSWDIQRKLRRARGEAQVPGRPPTAMHQAIQRRMTGPHLPRVKTGMYPAVKAAQEASTKSPDLDYLRRRKLAEERRRQRIESDKAKLELRKLYREALGEDQ